MNWNPIKKACTEAAEAMGHKLEWFKTHRSAPSVRTAMCEACYGCCWVAYTPAREFIAGGRLLKFRCGTPEAAGLLTPQKEPANG